MLQGMLSTRGLPSLDLSRPETIASLSGMLGEVLERGVNAALEAKEKAQ
jgi:hypothetical protein